LQLPAASFLSAILLLPTTAISKEHNSVDEYWVEIHSQPEESGAIVGIRKDWPERSLARRTREGRSLDSHDLPLSEEVIESIRSAGGVIRQQSRWLRSVSITADEKALAQIRRLPAVRSITTVGRIQSSGRSALESEGSETENPETGRHFPEGHYGLSWRQAEQAGAIEAHRRGLSGRGVVVGFLDTGYQLDHRAFAGLNLLAQFDFIFGDDDPSYDPGTDPRGQASHGTACLSVVGGYDPGRLVGIAPNATFALAKTEFTGSETIVEEDDWIAGLEWLEWIGADVVSSSLNYRDWYRDADLDGQHSPVSRAARRAVELGVVICNSASNAGPGAITIGAPADAEGILAVAAVDSNGQLTRFSSRGPTADGRIKPDVAAMGRAVVCVSPLTFGRYSRWNGTSLATPIVAGVAALVREAHPDWPASKVVEAIRETANRAARPDYGYGFGIIDAAAAVDYPSLTVIPKLPGGASLWEIDISIVGTYGRSLRPRTQSGGVFVFTNLPSDSYRLTLKRSQHTVFRTGDIVVPPSLSLEIDLTKP